MSIENKVNNYLNKYPNIKRMIKRCYQLFRYSISKKITAEGNIIRITPNDGFEYFFGYYDKSPWDITNRYIVCLRTKCTYKSVAPAETADIILIDTVENNKISYLATTHSWNVQQGCMLQWLGPDYKSKIIYNDFKNNKYCSVILDIFSKEEKFINMPIYAVSSSGDFALSLDFSRLHTLRPGYGYSNLVEENLNIKLPNDYCIWRINFNNNEIIPLMKYTDFYDFETRNSMVDAVHKVNHIMLSPNNNRFMILHRWYQKERKYSRLITCDVNGRNMYNLSDDDMVSHCFWKNDNEIIAFEKKNDEGYGYFLMVDKTQEYIHLWKNIENDGHPSYSPNGIDIVVDSYPDSKRIQTITCLNESGDNHIVAKVFSPFKYDNELRCDLHPRWSRDGKKICFDSTFEGKRGLYYVNMEE